MSGVPPEDDEDFRLAEIRDDGRVFGSLAEGGVADEKDVDPVCTASHELFDLLGGALAKDSLDTAVVRRALRALEPFSASLHPDRPDRVDHDADVLHAETIPEELPREEGLLVGHVCGGDDGDLLGARGADGLPDRVEGLAPCGDAEVVVFVADLRYNDAIRVVTLVRKTAV